MGGNGKKPKEDKETKNVADSGPSSAAEKKAQKEGRAQTRAQEEGGERQD